MASRRPIINPKIAKRIESDLASILGPSIATHAGFTKPMLEDRAYELRCLTRLMQEGASLGMSFALANGATLKLRGSHGPISPRFSHIVVTQKGRIIGHLWNNVQFFGLSLIGPCSPKEALKRHAHELDVALVKPSRLPQAGNWYPHPSEVIVGLEAKNRPYSKALLREALGTRRELSYLRGRLKRSRFGWPQQKFRASPHVSLVAMSSSSLITDYADPNLTFGIHMLYQTL